MKFLTGSLFLTGLLCASFNSLAASCGPYNAGALPNNGYSYCINETVQRYNYCGGTAGQLQGLKDHPLMCGDSNFNVTNEWQPKPETVRVCKNVVFEQCATRAGTTRCRSLYSKNKGWSWSPSLGTVCNGESFTQTSNCGVTRTRTGTKDCCTAWAPAQNTICSTETFTQTNSCGGSRERTGTKDCCVVANWSPKQSDMCNGLTFTQTNNCGGTRQRTGTGSCISTHDDELNLNEGDFPHDERIARLTSNDLLSSAPAHIDENASNEAKLYSRKMPDDRTGTWVDYPIVVTGQNLPTNSQIPLFTRGEDLNAFLNAKAANSMANDPRPSDEVTFCLDTDITPGIDLASCVDTGPRQSACDTHQMIQRCDCAFDTRGTLFPLCDECEGAGPGFRTVNYTIPEDNNWRPARNSVCDGDAFTQTNDCGTTRPASGTRNCTVTPPPPPPPAIEWDYVGSASFNTQSAGAPEPFVLFQKSCRKFENGSLGLDRQRKWLRYISNNTRDPYPCGLSGDTDFCYESLTGEEITPGGGVEEAIRVNFQCR